MIRKVEENGNEYWSARELYKILGYTEWRNFNNVVIKRAKKACEENGQAVSDHFVQLYKVITGTHLHLVPKPSRCPDSFNIQCIPTKCDRACGTLASVTNVSRPEPGKQVILMKTYDDIAEWYDQWIGTHSMKEDPFFLAVDTLIGKVAGECICDLACGQGRVARHLADRGARIVGIDLSAKLLAIARHHEEMDPRGIEYVQADAQHLEEQVLGLFDGVVCLLALMDIPELAPTLQSVARILRPGGWFVFSILHPCFHTSRSGEIATPEGVVRTIGRYFVEGYWRSETRSGPPGKVGAYHRTLSTYVNTLTDVGLQLVRLSEVAGTSTTTNSRSLSHLNRPVWQEVPTVLVVSCRKPHEGLIP